MTVRTVLHRLWRVLRWALLGLALLAVGLVTALWWANRHDDVLLPEVAAAMAFAPPDAEAMRRNGYFTMLGLGAPPNEDALAAGQRFFAAQMADYRQFQAHGTLDSSSVDAAFPYRRVELGTVRCDAAAADCFSHYVKHADAIRALLAKHQALVARYLSLRDLPEYTEVIPPYVGLVFPHYADVVAASELVGMQAALALHAGQRAEAWRLLEANAAIHQRLWNGSRALIGAMIALAADMRQQRLVAGMARALAPLDADQATRWTRLVNSVHHAMAPVLIGERNFSLAAYGMIQPKYQNERTGVTWVFDRIERAKLTLTYLPNATLNAAYRSWEQQIREAGLPANQWAARSLAPAESAPAFPPPLRNPIGALLLNMGGAAMMRPYIERTHDVEGHRRLVQLQMAALRGQVAPERMPEWLAQQPAELRNPYTLQPMVWDASAGALLFEGRQPQTQNPEPRNLYRVLLHPTPS